MFPTPKPALTPNTYAYESTPLVKPTGFREYDARWLLEKEINLMGVQALGIGLGTLIRELGGITVYDVPAMVLPDEALAKNLLGVSFLSRLKRYEYANGRIVLEQ